MCRVARTVTSNIYSSTTGLLLLAFQQLLGEVVKGRVRDVQHQVGSTQVHPVLGLGDLHNERTVSSQHNHAAAQKETWFIIKVLVKIVDFVYSIFQNLQQGKVNIKMQMFNCIVYKVYNKQGYSQRT